MSSHAVELAREEEARIAAEMTPEGEPDEAPTGEPDTGDDAEIEEEEAAETPQPQPPTEAQIDATWKALEREAVRHAREVEKRAAQMFEALTPCPLCTVEGATPGFIFPQLPEPQQTLRREGITMALGGSGQVEYKADPDRVTCDACDGLGMLRTGSKVPGQDVLPCRGCNGQGWKQQLQQMPNLVAAPPMPNLVAPANGQPQIQPPSDQWGRPIGHPHFNIPPSQVGA